MNIGARDGVTVGMIFDVMDQKGDDIEDPDTGGRKVAVKVLRPELAAVVGHERFLQEISITANLQHPNILPLYESGMASWTSGDTRSTADHSSLAGRSGDSP